MNKIDSYGIKIISSALLLISCIIMSIFVVIPLQTESNKFRFPVSTLEEQNINKKEIDSIISYIDSNDYAIDSMVIVKNGFLVLERYPSPEGYTNYVIQGKREAHLIASCTKTVTSALIGIALYKGYLDNVSQKVVDFFPDRTIKNLDERKKSITIEDLLTMRAGFKWTQPFSTDSGYRDPSADHNKMTQSIDFTQYVLDRPMYNEPGTGWAYSNGNSHLLSAIIQKVTGMTTLEFGQKFLFEPLGIDVPSWTKSPEGINTGARGLRLTAIEMAKFGQLYLNNGSWNGKQIISKEYVQQSLISHHRFTNDVNSNGYGYSWWTDTQMQGVHCAIGAQGQYICVAPKYNLIVVFTASITSGDIPQPNLLVRIIGAIKS